MMSREQLFSEFNPVSSKEFKQKIQYDLKGAEYNEALIWKNREGIDVKPFYHRDEIETISSVPGLPEQWYIGEAIFILEAAQSAHSANKAISAGAEAIYFTADSPFEIEVLFDNLTSLEVPLYFELNFLNSDFYQNIYAYAKKYKINCKLDIINHLVTDGNWYTNLTKDHNDFKSVLGEGLNNFSVDTRIYQNAGSTIIQQLGYGLSHLNEYLNYCEQESITVGTIMFEVAIGTNYFFEIAKLRALRQTVAVLLNEYKNASGDIFVKTEVKIIAHPSKRNKTVYDYNTNMLRTTTECMSAILGGADWIVNLPYDALYHKTNDFGQRISRNQLIILREESYFNAVCNAADGSYYVEELTRQLSEKALTLFKDIEKNGGFLKQLKEGTIQRKIEESAKKEQEQFDNGEIALVGTNIHPNKEDRMKETIELYPFLKIKPRKTIIRPIIPRRLAEALEQERLSNES